MSLTQQKFLNASISGFSCNGGWGGTPSTLTVQLVEDETNNDYFLTPPMNSPAFFRYDSWWFDGIVTDIGPKYGESGNPTIDVILSSPDVFLDGIQLILDGYTGGVFNVPNLYNVFGYLESFGFGNSGRNEAGIPWRNVYNATERLINQVQLIQYAGYDYFIDMRELPAITPYYRINSDNISLLDFIRDITSIANYDFTTELVGNTIKIRTIDRGRTFTSGSINRFVNTTPGSVSRNNALQSEYNLTNRFVVGGQVEQMFYNSFYTPLQRQEIEGGGDDVELVKKSMKDTNTPVVNICQYWGTKPNGDAIFGFIDEKGRYAVTVDGYPITYAISGREWRREGLFAPRDFSQGYTFTLQELRVALISQQAWESFILLNDFEDNGFYTYLSRRLKLRGELKKDLKAIFGERDVNEVNPFELLDMSRKNREKEDDIYITRVYNFIKQYAEEYLGRKFMVRVPFTLARIDETQEIVTSYEIAESGFLEESLFQQQAANNLLPFDFDFITDRDGKITPFVRYDGAQYEDLDLSELSNEDFFIGNGRQIRDRSIENNPDTDFNEQNRVVQSLFIKCDVDPKLVFINKAAAFSPRAVVTLPAPIYYSDGIGEGQDENFVMKAVLDYAFTAVQDRPDKKFPGSDMITFGASAEPVKPDLAAIPLRNTLLNYGPWYTNNTAGKTEFVKNEDLAPWNFGGFAGMNQAGLSIANNSFGATLQAEGGSIDVPGTPTLLIGRELTSGGPFVTNIQVSVNESGVVTNYQMNRSSLRNGDNTNFIVENFKRMFEIRKTLNEKRKENRVRNPRLNSNQRVRLNNEFPRRKQSNSSSTVILGSLEKKEDEDFYESNVAIMPAYKITDSYQDDTWEKTGGVSLNAIFRPFSTTSGDENLPSYTDSTGSSPNVNDLNPYKEGHDIGLIFNNEDVDELKVRKKFEGGEDLGYRGLAFKGPLVVAGWGYDTQGNPVPASEEDEQEFLDGYLHRSDKWKVGPVDLRWDESRGVWVTGSGGGAIFGCVLTSDIGQGSASAEIYSLIGGNAVSLLESEVFVFDPMGVFTGGQDGSSGYCEKVGSSYILVNLRCI